jgi:hypothetical protein
MRRADAIPGRPAAQTRALRWGFGGIVLIAATATACAGRAPLADHPLPPVPPRHAALFALPDEPLRPAVGAIERRGTYTVRRVSFPSVLEAPGLEPVQVLYYLPNQGRRFPLAIVLPITRGDFFSRRFALFLVERGYACVQFRSQGDLGRLHGDPVGLPLFRDLLRARVIDTRRLLQWVLTHDEIDGNRIGLVGFSHGALVGGLLIAVEPRIKAAVLMLGAGDLSGVIASSAQSSLRRIREGVTADQGLTTQEFYDAAAATLEDVDPLTYAPLVAPWRVVMINARFDRVIKRRYVEALWREYGQPELVWLPTGHYTAALFSPYARQKVLTHFRRVFGGDR